MPRKKRTLPEHVRADRHWIVTDEIKVNGRVVNRDTEVKIKGEGSTRFAFRRHVLNPANGAEWVDVMGGSNNSPETIRSFRPDRITTVHRIQKRRAASKAPTG